MCPIETAKAIFMHKQRGDGVMAPRRRATAASSHSTSQNARRAGSTSAVWGYVIVLIAGVSFITSMYMMVFAKLPRLLLLAGGGGTDIRAASNDHGAQPSEHTRGLLTAIEQDYYYCYLVPLTIPVSILACYANWVSLKFFRHN